MSDKRIFMTMRHMAWEKAKGEIHAMLQTYWDEQEKWEKMNQEFEEFVNKVENDGLHE